MSKLILIMSMSFIMGVGHTEAANKAFPHCEAQKFHQYIEARKNWIYQLTQIIINKVPEMRHEAILIKNHDMLTIKAQTMEFSYLSRHNPNKLKLNKPVHLWLNLSDADKDAIARADKLYRQLHQVESLSSEDKIRLRALRQHLGTKIMQTQEFIDLAMANKDMLSSINMYPCE